MPQMSPLMWFSLFIMFSMTLIMFNMMNYYSFQYKPLSKSFSFMMKMNSWKW